MLQIPSQKLLEQPWTAPSIVWGVWSQRPNVDVVRWFRIKTRRKRLPDLDLPSGGSSGNIYWDMLAKSRKCKTFMRFRSLSTGWCLSSLSLNNMKVGWSNNHTSGWWLTYPSEKYAKVEFVSWGHDIPSIWKVIIHSCSSHHQPDINQHFPYIKYINGKIHYKLQFSMGKSTVTWHHQMCWKLFGSREDGKVNTKVARGELKHKCRRYRLRWE